MIKNEAHILKRCLDAIDKLIDYFIFVDTGSTDKTLEIIDNFLKDRPGEVHKTKWINFGHNRTEALTFCKGKGDYIVIVDADDIWNVSSRPEIRGDCAKLRVSTGREEFDQIRFLKGDLVWRYIGAKHAYPDTTGRSVTLIGNEVWIKSTQEGASWNDPDKFAKNAIEIELDNPEDKDPRKIFYAACSYKDAKNYPRARKLFKKRISVGGWQDEIWFSQYSLGIMDEIEDHLDNAIIEYLKAINLDDTRAEAFTAICRCFRKMQVYGTGYMFGKAAMKMKINRKKLFIVTALYTTDLYDELSICAYHMEKFHEAAALTRKALKDQNITPEARTRLESNLKFAEDQIHATSKRNDRKK